MVIIKKLWPISSPCPDDKLVISMSVSHAVGCEFASQPGHTKDHINGTNCFPPWHAGITCRVGV